MIKLNHFSFSYIENRIILDDLNFHIQKGEKVGIIGCNGAGKSTLLKTIIGIENGQGELKVTDLTMNNKTLHPFVLILAMSSRIQIISSLCLLYMRM